MFSVDLYSVYDDNIIILLICASFYIIMFDVCLSCMDNYYTPDMLRHYHTS